MLNLGLEGLQAAISDESEKVIPSKEQLYSLCLGMDLVITAMEYEAKYNSLQNLAEMYKASKKYTSQECISMIEDLVGCSVETFLKKAQQYAIMEKDRQETDKGFEKKWSKKKEAWKSVHLNRLKKWYELANAAKQKAKNQPEGAPKLVLKATDGDLTAKVSRILQDNKNAAGLTATITALSLAVSHMGSNYTTPGKDVYGVVKNVEAAERLIVKAAKAIGITLSWAA